MSPAQKYREDKIKGKTFFRRGGGKILKKVNSFDRGGIRPSVDPNSEPLRSMRHN